MRTTLVMGWTTLFMSFLIAACAAYFSITGLAALFAAALVPVIIMATVLEFGKIGATFFLHRFWHDLPGQLKYPLTMMVVILMLITSMGIFGFLSKGHLEQETPAEIGGLQIERIDQQITREKQNISRQEAQLKRLQGIVDTLIEYDRIRGRDGADATLEKQQPERDEIQASMDKAYERINTLQEKRLPLQSEVSSIEAKLGPIKYVAELFGYDLATDPDGKGKAVRIVIVLFMLAFDPLAIWLVMAADWAFMRHRKEKGELGTANKEEKEKTQAELEEALVEVYARLEEKEMELREYTDILDELARMLDEKPTEIEKIIEVEDTGKIEELMATIDELTKQKNSIEAEITNVQEALNAKDITLADLKEALGAVRDELSGIRTENETLRSDVVARDKAVMALNDKYNLVEKMGLSEDNTPSSSAAPSFGTTFPTNPTKGQGFLRVDEMPSTLYRYDGSRWLEVVKDETVEYDEKYLQHLIDELGEGKVDLEELSPKEQEEIQNLLSKEDVLGR